MRIRVDCYAGYRGEETPRVIHLDSRQVAVTEVVDRWLSPDHRYFKVLGEDGATYIVRHDTATWLWELTFFGDAASPGFPHHFPAGGRSLN